MADVDPLLLSAELGITGLLVIQVVLAVVAVVAGCASRRRWARLVLLVTLILAAAACAGTLYRCEEARAAARGRLDGRVAGPHLPAERADQHLAWVADRLRLSIGVAAATWLAGGYFYLSGRRARSGDRGATPDPPPP